MSSGLSHPPASTPHGYRRLGSTPRTRRLSSALLAHAALLALAAVLGLAAVLAAPAGAGAATVHASQPLIERNVMCVTCKIPLDEAQSLQANRERELIRGLIAEGRDEAQIKAALVGQYGPSVLALPGAKGFDATVYVVPAAVLLLLLALLLLLLPSWRRRARARTRETGAAPSGAPQSISPCDAARLDADLARFD